VLHTGSPLKQTARGKPAHRAPIALFARFAKRRADQAEAATENGTILGVDQTSRKRVQLTDIDANKHTFVLGTIGSGKTVTVLNFVESAICRCLPLIYVDGKGDYDLAEKVIAYAEACGRPAYLFAMNGASCVYNPLATGGFSAKKDRIIELRHWSEDHYLKIAEGYMQTVFKVLEACGVQTDLVTVADYMDVEQLRNLIAARKPANADRLTAEVDRQEKAEPDVRSLCNEVINLATSEIGHLFDTANAPSHVPVLELLRAVEERAIVYFCLPALQFPALARTLGRLVINDLKSTVAEQLSNPEAARPVIYTVFDEFSVFAGEQVLNLINMGRSAGVRAVLATQSVADIGRAVTDSPDHFIRQVFASCNSYVIQRLNAAEDATTIVEMIGTKDGVEHTAQVDAIGATGLGSARRTKTFIVHPDAIKTQPMGHAVFVNKNRGTVQRILVRRGNIG
jgi:type IV secretory pathway TraG/TraD family ATPase VirD4